MFREDPIPRGHPVWGYFLSTDYPFPAPPDLGSDPADAAPGDPAAGGYDPGDPAAWVDVTGDAVPVGHADSAGHVGPVGDAGPAQGRGARRVPARWELPARRIVDLGVAVTALALLAVPMAVVAATIRLVSPGPALFRQRRIGQDGEPFTMYKFRTMRVGCGDGAHRELIARELRGEDTSADGSWKIHEDSRVIPLGDWLRRTSVDELPQLFNVVLGQMSLVGPRPCLDWEADMFPPEYADRFTVRPGLTGLWQVNGRSTMGTLDMLELDVVYARDWSFWGDLKILARTLPTLLHNHSAR